MFNYCFKQVWFVCFFKADYFSNISQKAKTNEAISTRDEDLEMQLCSARFLTAVKKQQQKPSNKPHTADQRLFQLIHNPSPACWGGLDF